MKLDATDLRYVTSDEFRVLKGIEQGCRAHEVIPTSQIPQLSGLHHSGLNRLISSLAKRNLIAREQNVKYDGYRLTYGGYDYLAVRALKEKDLVQAVGHRVGVGKESDIYLVSAPEPTLENRILKIHRLGRISFRAVKSKRDYTNKLASRQKYSWMYLSRLAAAKEYLFMDTLHKAGFPVPVPLGQSRHAVLMSLVDAYPLRQIAELPRDQIPLLYSALMALIVRLARAGLVHGDFNEFNLLVLEQRDNEEEPEEAMSDEKAGPSLPSVASHANGSSAPGASADDIVESGKGFERFIASDEQASAGSEGSSSGSSASSDEEDGEELAGSAKIHLETGTTVTPIVIDFPQMVSVLHINAEAFFDRDVECIRRFFLSRFRFESQERPRFADIVESAQSWEEGRGKRHRLRAEAEKSGVPYKPGPEEEHFLDLDVLTKASGYSREEKKRGHFEELEQYLSRMRLDEPQSDNTTSSANLALKGNNETGEVSSDEDADDLLEQMPLETGGQRSAKTATNPARTGVAPRDSEDVVAAQIAKERRQAQRFDAKHHGKKSLAGKVGKSSRGSAGAGKKKGNASVVKDASVF